MKATLTIVIPVYNEQENLNRVEVALRDYMSRASVPTSVLFVNDGSTDASLNHIRSICKNSQNFRYLSFDQNYGLSAALKAGFDHVNTSLVGYMDADLQTRPEDFDLLLPYMSAYDLVTGVRSHRQDRWIKSIASRISNGIRRLFTNDGVVDTCCPLKIIKTEYAQRIPMFSGLHRFLPAMILLQKGKVKQVPVPHYERIAGTSSFGIWNRLLGPFLDCFAYLWMRKKYIHYSIRDSDNV